MSISEILSRAAVTKEVVQCPCSGAHGEKCACRGTHWVKSCEGCEGSGWNAKMQKTCRPCRGRGCVTAVSPGKA
jgi:hypothetical protein